MGRSKGEGGNNAHPSKVIIPANFNRTQNAYPETELKVLELAKMVSEGKTRETCLKHIMETKNIKMQQARQYYDAAIRYLMPDDLDEYKKEILAKNFERLETIVERGMKDSADLRLAKEAIAELNRMCGIGGNKVTMAKSKDGDEMIQINFD